MHIQILKLLLFFSATVSLIGCSRENNEAPKDANSSQEAPKVAGSPPTKSEDTACTEASSKPKLETPAAKSIPEEPEPPNLPTDLKEFKVELQVALGKISKEKNQTCMVNSEYSESLLGLSTLINVYCNLEKVASKLVHEFGFRRTAELHMLSMYVVKNAFRLEGFSVLQCGDLPSTSESGLSITGQSACSFSRTKDK